MNELTVTYMIPVFRSCCKRPNDSSLCKYFCRKKLWEGIISFPLVKTGPVVLEQSKEALKFHSVWRIQTALITAATHTTSGSFHSSKIPSLGKGIFPILTILIQPEAVTIPVKCTLFCLSKYLLAMCLCYN